MKNRRKKKNWFLIVLISIMILIQTIFSYQTIKTYYLLKNTRLSLRYTIEALEMTIDMFENYKKRHEI